MHLVPCFVLAAVLLLAWRWEWIGAALYGGAALVYVVSVSGRRLPLPVKANWMLVIAGPALIIAGLFWVNWLKRGELHTRR
jgi:O-antigen/teichoic acid export membrane protein